MRHGFTPDGVAAAHMHNSVVGRKVKEMLRPILVGACVLALVYPLAGASAQSASVSAQSATGANGIKLGEGRLHPYGEIDTHFVFNPGRLSNDRRAALDSSSSDGLVSYRAGLDYQLPSPTVELDFNSQLFYNQYFRLDDELSGFNADVAASLQAFKDRPFSLRATAGYIRSNLPGNQSDRSTLLHDDFLGGLGFTLRPGGGALTISLDYQAYFQSYSTNLGNTSVLVDPELFNNLRQTGSARAGWKFLPKTSVFLETSFSRTTYPDDSLDQNFNANILESYVGLSGAISTRLSLLAKAGYGNPFTSGQPGSSFVPVIGQLELGYMFSETSRITVGVFRRSTAQPVFGFVAENMFYLNLEQQFGKVQFSLRGETGLFSYGGQVDSASSDTRNDFGAELDASISYAMTDWLTIGVTDRLDYRASNYDEVLSELLTDQVVSDFGYLTNDLFLRLSARY